MDKRRIFLEVASTISKMSKCVSYQVGAVIVKDGRIISTGYNGTPAGYMNCCERFPHYNPTIDRDEHRQFSDKFELHAELNAILYAARHGASIEGATLYCTVEPCINCAKNMTQSGIKEIYFSRVYDRNFEIRPEIFSLYRSVHLQVWHAHEDGSYVDYECLL